MLARYCLLFVSLLWLTDAGADTPDKKRMVPCAVTLKSIGVQKGYTFYWKIVDNTLTVKQDTTLIIPASGGAPFGVDIWALNQKTGKSTDTIHLDNYYAPDYIISIDSINKRHYS
jgi:hypothetical protein